MKWPVPKCENQFVTSPNKHWIESGVARDSAQPFRVSVGGRCRGRGQLRSPATRRTRTETRQNKKENKTGLVLKIDRSRALIGRFQSRDKDRAELFHWFCPFGVRDDHDDDDGDECVEQKKREGCEGKRTKGRRNRARVNSTERSRFRTRLRLLPLDPV